MVLGLADDSYGAVVNHDKLYVCISIQGYYRACRKCVIQRRDRCMGLRYNEDPPIMTFELDHAKAMAASA